MRKQPLGVVLAFSIAAMLGSVLGRAEEKQTQAAEADAVTAIDILLEPDQTMMKKAVAANERLLKDFPKGFALDKTHQPHITCLQRFVKTADLDKVYEAVGKVLDEEKPTRWKLKANKYFYAPWGDSFLAVIMVEPTDEIIRYQKKLIEAVAPFTAKTGTARAFATTKEAPDINQPTIDWVEKFVPNQIGKKFEPHVTVGMGTEDYLKKLVAEKFEAFTFSPTGVSIYHLGNFGTARTKLKGWEPKTSLRHDLSREISTMLRRFSSFPIVALLLAMCLSAAPVQPQDQPIQPQVQPVVDPLPSWNDGKSKRAILAFVKKITDKSDPDHVPPAERIAVFDNDGTLWSEQPMYFQLAFLLDRVKALAPKHPEWKNQQPFQAALEGDMKALGASGEKGLMELLIATSTGMTTGEFETIVKDWLATAKHPRFKRPYTDLVFQPMLELLSYLRANGLKTCIVSGGGVEFVRTFAEKVYGIPPEQVIGSRMKHKFEMRKGGPILIRLAALDFYDDGPDKPVGIFNIIGRVPIFAFGNSDGDKEMLQWVAARKGASFMGIVHHTDGVREYAYDRTSHFGRLDKALDEGRARGWTIADMKSEWKVIYPFEK